MSTTIAWTDETWNPLRASVKGWPSKVGWACVRVSPGCKNCYAATFNKRLGTGLDYTVPNISKVETVRSEKALTQPYRWKKARRVFVCSMSDLFGEWVTDDEIEAVFGVMATAPQHTFQVLTKRPERMRRFLHDIPPAAVLPNVWLGTSVEDQQRADERIPHLLATPAAVRFLSCEPLLGPLNLGRINSGPSNETIDWVIVGGESGGHARPMDLAWARGLRDQCQDGGVAFFYKQGGASNRCPHDAKGEHPECHPTDLRIREWPEVRLRVA